MQRILTRSILWCATIAVLLLLASHWLLLNYDSWKLVGLHAPMWITVALAVIAVTGMHGFVRARGRMRGLYAVAAIAGLLFFGFSLRWVGTYISGSTQEYWAGWRVADVDTGADDDYCYRMNGRTFELRGLRYGTRFTYWRGIWPTDFSEAELKARFANRAEPRGDGWNCTPPTPPEQLAPGSRGRPPGP